MPRTRELHSLCGACRCAGFAWHLRAGIDPAAVRQKRPEETAWAHRPAHLVECRSSLNQQRRPPSAREWAFAVPRPVSQPPARGRFGSDKLQGDPITVLPCSDRQRSGPDNASPGRRTRASRGRVRGARARSAGAAGTNDGARARSEGSSARRRRPARAWRRTAAANAGTHHAVRRGQVEAGCRQLARSCQPCLHLSQRPRICTSTSRSRTAEGIPSRRRRATARPGMQATSPQPVQMKCGWSKGRIAWDGARWKRHT